MSKKSLVKNTVVLLAMQLAGYIFPLITFPYLSRVLTSEYFGLVSFCNSFIIYFQILIDFGFILYGTERCAKFRNDKIELSKITFSIIYAKILLSLLGLILLIVPLFLVDNLRVNSTYIFTSYVPLILNVFIPDFLFRGLEKMENIAFMTIFSGFIYTIAIYLFVNTKGDYIYIPVITIFSTLITVFWAWLNIWKNKVINVCVIDKDYSFSLMKDSSSFFLSRIAVSVFGSSNIFILGTYGISNATIGQFSLANNLINIFKAMQTPLADSIYPYMIKEKNYRLIKNIILIAMPILFLIVTVLFIFSEDIILLLGGVDFLGSVKYFQLMLPLIFISLPTYLLGFPTLSPLGLARKANFSVISGAAVHIALLVILFLLKKINVLNIIYITILTEVLIITIRVYYIKKHFSNN